MTDYGWPPRMLMRVACMYTGRKRWTLARAARSGLLPVAGRNGRTLVFDREALDAWMIGDGTAANTNAAPRPAPIRTRAASPNISALDRIAAIRRGAR